MEKKGFVQKWIPKSRISFWLHIFGMVALQLLGTGYAETRTGSSAGLPAPLFQLQAANGQAIEFRSQNGLVSVGQIPEKKEIPHLVLFRNGALTDPEERTLQLSLEGLPVQSSSGLAYHLKVETQREDPDQAEGEGHHIIVWEQSRCLPVEKAWRTTRLTFKKEFGQRIDWRGQPVDTPSDYFRVELAIYNPASPGDPVFTISEDYALLMESQWVAPLEGLAELTPGAAPDELVLYYGDMFPFQQNPYKPETRLPRAGVHRYIQEELGPALVEVVREQTNEWGFPWHEDWKGFRQGSNGERLEATLVSGYEWFHGRAPTQAHAGISINLNYVNRSAYETLTGWIVSMFHHELFHNLQRNQNLAHGGSGDVAGKRGAWEFLAEGTAILASSAGNPEYEFAGNSRFRSYPSQANSFLKGTEFISSGLKTSYKEIDPSSTSIYWRFLYEQCSGPQGALGEFKLGMQVIRQTLNSLYAAHDLADISPEEQVEAIPVLMNRVLSKVPWCPFRTYEESLVQFSRAIYALRLEGGRCERAAGMAGCGFFDPNGMYAEPLVEEILYQGREMVYKSGIGSSFGMEFVEILLDSPAEGEYLELVFEPAEGSAARFSVQFWKLLQDEGGRIERLPNQTSAPKVLEIDAESGRAVYRAGRIDTARFERLGMAITRLDSRENQDPVGLFTISLLTR